MSNQEAYGYAAARIRATELRLLDAGVLQRMIDADDSASVLKILGETSYAQAIASCSGDSDFDKILESDLRAAYGEVKSFTPDKELVALMLLQYDFHNVKVLLKSTFNARSGGKKRWDLLTSLGSYPVDDMLSAIESEDYRLLPFGLNVLIPKCISVFEQTQDVLEVERMMDRRLFEAMLEKAETLDMPGVKSWVRARIDGENLRTLLRLKRFNFDAQKTLPFIHTGGTLDAGMLASLVAEPFETWARALDFSDFGPVLGSIDPQGSFSELILSLEKVLEDFYLEILAKDRYGQASPGMILSYLWAKEMEIKNIRVILVSKAGKGDKDRLRGILRHGYN